MISGSFHGKNSFWEITDIVNEPINGGDLIKDRSLMIGGDNSALYAMPIPINYGNELSPRGTKEFTTPEMINFVTDKIAHAPVAAEARAELEKRFQKLLRTYGASVPQQAA